MKCIKCVKIPYFYKKYYLFLITLQLSFARNKFPTMFSNWYNFEFALLCLVFKLERDEIEEVMEWIQWAVLVLKIHYRRKRDQSYRFNLNKLLDKGLTAVTNLNCPCHLYGSIYHRMHNWDPHRLVYSKVYVDMENLFLF